MRLRNKKWTVDFLQKNQHYLICEKYQNNFKNNNKQIYLEIGCGKGDFIIENAIKNPNINFIAMEKQKAIIGVAIKKMIELNLDNLLFINNFAENLNIILEPKTISKIYLNFSDPWPKKRHFKKRLVYRDFLNIYKNILVDDGVIEIKTDNEQLYDFCLSELIQINSTIVCNTNDLYNNQQLLENNIATEYEKKFIKDEKKIKKIISKL